MPLRVLAYAGDLLLRYELPVYSVVLYLSANAGQRDPGGYSYGDDTFGLQHRYSDRNVNYLNRNGIIYLIEE